MFVCRHTLVNNSDKPFCLFVEPEGWDCWLLPGETVEIRCNSITPTAQFEFSNHEDGISVYPSNDMEGLVAVYSGDTELECAHNRPPNWP